MYHGMENIADICKLELMNYNCSTLEDVKTDCDIRDKPFWRKVTVGQNVSSKTLKSSSSSVVS